MIFTDREHVMRTRTESNTVRESKAHSEEARLEPGTYHVLTVLTPAGQHGLVYRN